MAIVFTDCRDWAMYPRLAAILGAEESCIDPHTPSLHTLVDGYILPNIDGIRDDRRMTYDHTYLHARAIATILMSVALTMPTFLTMEMMESDNAQGYSHDTEECGYTIQAFDAATDLELSTFDSSRNDLISKGAGHALIFYLTDKSYIESSLYANKVSYKESNCCRLYDTAEGICYDIHESQEYDIRDMDLYFEFLSDVDIDIREFNADELEEGSAFYQVEGAIRSLFGGNDTFHAGDTVRVYGDVHTIDALSCTRTYEYAHNGKYILTKECLKEYVSAYFNLYFDCYCGTNSETFEYCLNYKMAYLWDGTFAYSNPLATLSDSDNPYSETYTLKCEYYDDPWMIFQIGHDEYRVDLHYKDQSGQQSGKNSLMDIESMHLDNKCVTKSNNMSGSNNVIVGRTYSDAMNMWTDAKNEVVGESESLNIRESPIVPIAVASIGIVAIIAILWKRK